MTAQTGDPEFAERPILGVGGLLFKGERVLLIKRGAPPAKGRWSIPGGKVRHGETVERAVEREMLEETGLRVRARELVTVYERLPRHGEDGHYVVLDYLCEAAAGEVRAGDDAEAAEWFELEALDNLNLTRGAAAVIRSGFRMAGQQ